MRALPVVLLAGALLAPLALTAVPDPNLRTSIVIRSDTGFLDPASGVRGGSGTPEDPYVISGWRILASDLVGVQLKNTSAHVVIRDLTVVGTPLDLAATAACAGLLPPCRFTAGFRLDNASNVRVEDVRLEGVTVGVVARQARSVELANFDVEGLDGWTTAAWLDDVADLRLRQFAGDVLSPTVRGARNLAVEDSVFVGSALLLWDFDGVRIDRNVFRNLTVSATPSAFHGGQGDGFNLTVRHNTFDGSGSLNHRALQVDEAQGVLICGNVFRRAVGFALGVGSEAVVHGNLLAGNSHGAMVIRAGPVFHENRFEGNSGYALVTGRNTMATGNAFTGNGMGVRVGVGSDLTGSWWGHPDGPSIGATLAGDRLTVNQGTATYAPWATVDPGLAPHCP